MNGTYQIAAVGTRNSGPGICQGRQRGVYQGQMKTHLVDSGVQLVRAY